MTMEFFPDLLTEVLNGVLSIVLIWMLVFLLVHLYRTYCHLCSRYGGRWGGVRSLFAMYRENKPEIALGTIVAFFAARTSFLWYVRFMKNNGHDNFALHSSRSLILTLTTLGLITGVSCWIRSISPYDGVLAFWIWTAMIMTALAFGLGMAYLF